MLTITYCIYIAVSALLTIWVAHSLSTRGRVFLIQFMDGQESLADSVNHLLVVGFYLLNFGYAMLALSYGSKPHTVDQAIEFLSFKLGLVLVVLGATHFFNMGMIAKLGTRIDAMIKRSKMSSQQAAADTPAVPPPFFHTP